MDQMNPYAQMAPSPSIIRRNAVRREQNLYSKTFKKLRGRWKDLSPKEELVIIFNNIINYRYLIFTLVLSIGFTKKLKGLSNKEMTDLVRRRLNTNFKNNLGYLPKILFILEGQESQCLHLHGVIGPKSDLILSQKQKERIAKIMKKTAFGPDYKNNPMSKNILRLGEVYAPKGWLRYMAKDFKNTKKAIYSQFYICHDLRREAKKYYEKTLIC
ncbi:MAG: hypothetical protein AB7U85_00455 [Alphaproteobacteria bacterium]